MTKVLMVISSTDFQDKEYGEPRRIFDENNFQVKVASTEKVEAKGSFGSVAKIDLIIEEVEVSEFDAVVFVGGYGMSLLVDNKSLQKLVRDFYNTGKITAAICIAPAILANAGILKEKKATMWSGKKEIIEEAGGEYIEEKVAVDGNIITGNGPEAAEEFGVKIVEKLS